MNQVKIEVNDGRMNVTFPDGESGTLEGADAAQVVSMLHQRFCGGSAPNQVTQRSSAPIANIVPLGMPVWNFRETEPERAGAAVPQPAPAAAAPVFNGTVKPLGLPVMNFDNPLARRGKGSRSSASTQPVTVANNGVRPLGPTPPLFPRKNP